MPASIKPFPVRAAWALWLTNVDDELNKQVHVDLVRVHVLQHLPGPAAEVV